MPAENALSVVIVQGSASNNAVVESISAIVASALPLDIQAVVAPSNIEAIEGALVHGTDRPDPRVGLTTSLGSLVSDRQGEFIGFVQPGNIPRSGVLERHLKALQRYPEAVLTLCRTDQNWELWSQWPESHVELIDGRIVGRALLLAASRSLATQSTLLVRRNAIGLRDIELAAAYSLLPFEDDPNWLLVTLQLLARGQAWCDNASELLEHPVADRAIRTDHSHWIDAIACGTALGLLDEPGDAERMLIDHTKATAELVREAPSAERHPSGDRHSDAIQFLVARWHEQLAAEDGPLPQLPLQIVVIEANVDEVAAETRELTSQMAQRVNFVAPPLGSQLDQDTSFGELPMSWLRDEELTHSIDEPRLPILLLRPGEQIEVCDRGQFERLLSNRELVGFGEVDTPTGRQRRLIWPTPAPSATTESFDKPVHSIRIRPKGTSGPTDWLQSEPPSRTPYPLSKFIIAAPDYTDRHGGVVALHRLCDRLNALGYEAYIEPTGETGARRHDWLTPFRRGRSFDDSVVIYPEVVSGNPFNARRAVRWLLNRPGWFTRTAMDINPDDLVVTFSRQISNDLPVLEVPLVDPTVFFPKDQIGSGALLWIGKGVFPTDFDRSEATLVTSSWPRTREALAARLRSATVLYSCDWLTSLVDEALMCGTPVVLIGDQSWSPNEIALRPGMAFDDGTGLDRAQREVGNYYPDYLERAQSTNASIKRFVQLVNDHFAEGASS